MPADWILTNGRVLILDTRRSVAAALAIQGESILATGSMRSVAPVTVARACSICGAPR